MQSRVSPSDPSSGLFDRLYFAKRTLRGDNVPVGPQVEADQKPNPGYAQLMQRRDPPCYMGIEMTATTGIRAGYPQ